MLDVRIQVQSRFVHLFIIHKSKKKRKKQNKLKTSFHFYLMWEMLYSLLESERHIVFLLLVTLFTIFCSLVSSHFFAALSSVFFFSFVHTIFQLSSPSTQALFLLVGFFFFSLLAAQLHFCLLLSTFLATDVERSPGSPQIRCCWWPPNSSYIAAHHGVREAISVFISSSPVGGEILALKSQDQQEVVCVGHFGTSLC